MHMLRLDSITGLFFRANVLAVGAALALAAGTASAATIPAGFGLDIQISNGTNTWTADEAGLAGVLSLSANGDVNTLALTAPQTVLSGGATIQSWDSTYDPDPFVTNNFVVVNNSLVTQTFFVSVTAPVTPTFLATTIIQSNIILTINDDNGTGGASVSSTGGNPVYEAFVNAGSALTFLNDPFSNSCASAFDCTFNGFSGAGVASQPFGPASVTSIGITIRFALSPGDSAAVQSRFEVVPEPTTAALLGLGLIGLAVRRRAARRA